MKSRFAVLGGLCCTLTFAANVAAETIVHEDFEGPFAPIERMESPDGTFLREGALPAGWEDHSESTPQHVKYGLSADPYEGKQALRIEVSNIQAGNSAAQLVRRGIALKKGCVYVMSMALRSVELQSVDIGFRPASGPNQWNLSCEAVASPDWAVSEFVVVAPASDPNAILQLRVRRAGAAEIDNVRVEELTREEFLQRYPAKPGNILETSRFSLGAANGWTLPRNGGTFVTDPNEKGPSGAPALKILVQRAEQNIISPPMRLAPGQTVRVSFYAKSAEPGATASASLRLSRYREGSGAAAKQFPLSAKWERFSMSGEVPFDNKSAYLNISVSKTALIDAVQVEEGAGVTDYAGQKPVEVCVIPTRDYGIFFEGEPLEFRVAATGRWAEGAKIKARVVDLFDRAESLPDIDLAKGPLDTTISAPLSSIPFGFFRVELQAVDAAGAALTPYGEAVAMRLHKPRFPDEDRPDSPFGIHVLATEKQTTMAHALGFKWVRIHDASPHITKWYAVEPQRGQWHWSDDQADIYRQHHLMILGTLDTSPRWASRADPKIETDPKRMEKYVPKDMDAWSEYCRETTAHYKGTIDAWEIWNEPYGFGFYRDVVNGQVVHATPEQFAEVAKRAYEAAHQSNPNCVVMTSVGSVPTWTEGCARSGAVNFADFFTHHQYVMQLPGGPNDTIARNMAMWRAGLPENLRDKTSWDTEGGAGVNAHTFYSHIPIGEARRDARYFADHSARYYISCLANGVPKFFLYSFHSHGGLGNASFSSIDGDGTLQPLAAAVSALAWHIEGKRFVRMAPLSGTTWAYLFTDGKESVAAIVNAPGKTCALPKIDGAECRDLLGSPIALPAAVGPETSYITSKAAPDALLKGLEAKSL